MSSQISKDLGREPAHAFVDRRAGQLLQSGLAAVDSGNIEQALNEFRASANLKPSADALTYWAWMESRLGHFSRAIELCEQAVGLDPQFGNPLNDIGTYLVALDKTDDALQWFERAKSAKRYDSRHFPYVNLGKIYYGRQQYKRALEEFELAHELAPQDLSITKAIHSLRELIQ